MTPAEAAQALAHSLIDARDENREILADAIDEAASKPRTAALLIATLLDILADQRQANAQLAAMVLEGR